jgi:hypothetical protein
MAILSWSASRHAQFTLGFSDAAQSMVHHITPSVMPKRICSALQTRGGAPDVTIMSAATVATANGVPEHYRVNGVIAPEIGFEVDLPATWNAGFYMFGNGGLAGGERPDEPLRAEVRNDGLRHNFVVARTNAGHENKRELTSFALCAYPKVAKYDGTRSTDDAGNFIYGVEM